MSVSLYTAPLGPNVLLTMYGNPNANSTVPQPAPALGGNVTEPRYTNASTTTAPTAIRLIASTVTYVSVCSTNPAQLVTLTYSSTITVCPTATTDAFIPMATITQSCNACGQHGRSTVTLTVPIKAIQTQTQRQLQTQAQAQAQRNVTAGTGSYRMPMVTAHVLPVSAAAPRASDLSILAALMAVVGIFVA